MEFIEEMSIEYLEQRNNGSKHLFSNYFSLRKVPCVLFLSHSILMEFLRGKYYYLQLKDEEMKTLF